MPTSKHTPDSQASLSIISQTGAGQGHDSKERARHTPARFVQIPPKRGVRVGDAMRKLREEDGAGALIPACAVISAFRSLGENQAYGLALGPPAEQR